MACVATDTISTQKQKNAARLMFRAAVNSGSISKASLCEECGSGKCVLPHHHDYSKPFEVKWLCSVCHGKAHSKGGNGAGKHIMFYLNGELWTELQAEAAAYTKEMKPEHAMTPQSMLRMAWDTRPARLRLAFVEKLNMNAKAGAKKGGR